MYNSTLLKVRKWGNSLGIRIPKQLAEILNVSDGSELRMVLKEDYVMLALDKDFPYEALEKEIPVPDEKNREKEAVSEENGGVTYQENGSQIELPRPDYTSVPKGEKTPIKLTDDNFGEVIEKYPLMVVLFLDYMYLDFYERIEEHLVHLRELSERYSGLAWFGVASMEDNDFARESYVGNVWGEEEVRIFVNGRLKLKTNSTRNIEKMLKKIIPGKRIGDLKKRKGGHTPMRVNNSNIHGILTSNNIVVAGFFPPGDMECFRIFNSLSKHYTENVRFVLSKDNVVFNEKSRTFYRNPLFEKYNVEKELEIIIFKKGKIIKRFNELREKQIKETLESILSRESQE